MTELHGLPEKALRRVRAMVAQGDHRLREYYWRLSAAGRRNARCVRGLRNAYAGRRCFILGGGPSLRATDVRLLKGEVTIGSNALFLLFDEMGYRPTFLTVEDTLVAEDRAGELNAMRGTTKLFPRDLAYCLTADDETVFVNFVRHYPDSPRFSEDFERIVYWGGTVTFLNLQLAYFIGCSKIYLIGMDHSYRVPSNLASPVITSTTDDVNHFHPGYFGKGYRWHDPLVERMEAAYKAARSFLEARGVGVYNATAGGRLEVFERVDYATVVREERGGPGSP